MLLLAGCTTTQKQEVSEQETSNQVGEFANFSTIDLEGNEIYNGKEAGENLRIWNTKDT